MITPRENLLRIFRNEQPDWLPIAGHCDPYNQPSREGMHPELATELGKVVGMDDTSTTAISPSMFEACNLDLTDIRVDAAHSAGKLYFHHSCGLIHDLLPLYRRTKMDAVHAFTIPSVGDVTAAEGRKAFGDGVTVIAMAQQLVGPMGDRAAVRADIHRMLREVEPWDHFILNVAAYPHRTLEQTQFVVDCCREIGSGPQRDRSEIQQRTHY